MSKGLMVYTEWSNTSLFSSLVTAWKDKHLERVDTEENGRIRTQARPVAEIVFVKQCSCLQVEIIFFNL